MRRIKLTEEQAIALNKIATRSKMNDWFSIDENLIVREIDIHTLIDGTTEYDMGTLNIQDVYVLINLLNNIRKPLKKINSMSKFLINGRTKEVYELTNEELISLVNEENLQNEDIELLKSIIKRFKYACCKRSGETNDNVFARQFSDFVNGRMCSHKETAKLMANDHRYLQQEMFKVFLAYAQILSTNYKNGLYDGRNEYSCRCANEIISALEEKKLI